MNQTEFIEKQMRKFNSVNDRNVGIWINDYKDSLINPNIVYEKLDKKIVDEWKSSFELPPTSWIKQSLPDCLDESVKGKDPEVIKAHQINNDGAPPPESWSNFGAKLKANNISSKLAKIGVA